MSGLVRRLLATIKDWWNTASTAVLACSEGARVVRTIAVQVVGAASAALVAIRERHRGRMARDPSYRTAIATGLSALLITITPQPAVAAALAVLIAKHLGNATVSADQPAYGCDDEQDGYDAYDARRGWSTPARQSQRLWTATPTDTYRPAPRWAARTPGSYRRTGYDTIVNAIGTGVRAVGQGVGWAIGELGRGLSWLGNTTARLVGRAWPSAETWLRSTVARVAAPVREGVQWIGEVLTGTGVVAEGLARTQLVRSASTTGAKVAAGLLAVHAVSKGAVAAKIVAALPGTMDAVILLSNPRIALGSVAAVTVTAMGIALARLLAADNDNAPDDGGIEAVPRTVAADAKDVEGVLTDLEQIARSVHVVVEADGRVPVEGVPVSVPADLRKVVARIAAEAAVKHMQRTLRVRPTPSRDDRRVWTRAPRGR